MNYLFLQSKKAIQRTGLLLLCSFFALAVAAQSNITGTVRTESGAPLIGGSGTIKGTATGSSTSAEGPFSISAEPTATLVVSSVGFGTIEAPLTGRTDVAVTLSVATTQLEQVVVVGYGKQRKRDLTGS